MDEDDWKRLEGIVTLSCFSSKYAKISKPVASNFNGLAVWPDAQNGLYFANETMPPARLWDRAGAIRLLVRATDVSGGGHPVTRYPSGGWMHRNQGGTLSVC
jgi:hypothetical protein